MYRTAPTVPYRGIYWQVHTVPVPVRRLYPPLCCVRQLGLLVDSLAPMPPPAEIEVDGMTVECWTYGQLEKLSKLNLKHRERQGRCHSDQAMILPPGLLLRRVSCSPN